MADMEAIIAELTQSVPGAILQDMPPQHVVARREREIYPEQSRRLERYVLDHPRTRLAGAFVITEQPIDELPAIDSIIQATHKEDGLEALVWYKSYHTWLSHRWGIKILQEGVFYAARYLQDKNALQSRSKLDALDFLQLSFNMIQLHEHFHFVTDVACTLLELYQLKPLYSTYATNVYPHDKFEEAIANAYVWRMMRKEGIPEALKQFMLDQPTPYNQFQQWVGRRAFQHGRQQLMSLLFPKSPTGTGNVAGSELFFRIDRADLDLQDVPIYLESSRVARRVSSPLLFLCGIEQLVKTPGFDRKYALLPKPAQLKVDAVLDKLHDNVQNPSLHFEKMRGYGPVFTCRVDFAYRISLRHCGGDIWDLLRVGRHDDVLSSLW